MARPHGGDSGEVSEAADPTGIAKFGGNLGTTTPLTECRAVYTWVSGMYSATLLDPFPSPLASPSSVGGGDGRNGEGSRRASESILDTQRDTQLAQWSFLG